MRPCPGCVAWITRHPLAHVFSVAPWLARSTHSAIGTSSIASTSRLPGAPAISPKVELVIPQSSKSLKGKQRAQVTAEVDEDDGLEERAQVDQAPNSNSIKQVMVRRLQQKHPRAAYRVFKQALETPASLEHGEMVGLASLFVQYDEPELGLDAVLAIHKLGYNIPGKLVVQLLSTAFDELLLAPDKLSILIEWLKLENARADRRNLGDSQQKPDAIHKPRPTDEMVVKTMTLLRKMGRNEWALDVFESWVARLDEQDPGWEVPWTMAISLHAVDHDVRGAKSVFNAWRQRWQSAQEARAASVRARAGDRPVHVAPLRPPSRPYLTLINFLATQNTHLPVATDPLYRLLALLRTDNVALSISVYNALLRVELYRSRFGSFWGLWARMRQDGWQPNRATWRLLAKAQEWRDSLQRQRSRAVKSPLQSVLPGYDDARAPSSRELFRLLLSDHQQQTGHRPSLAKPQHTPSAKGRNIDGIKPLVDTSMLNAYLRLFVNLGDWAAATVVLESFGVYHCEPDEATHGAVILGVVRSWEKGTLRGELAEASGITNRLGYTSSYGPLRNHSSRSRRQPGGGTPASAVWRTQRGAQGLELVNRIVEARNMRVGLWTTRNQQTDVGGDSAETASTTAGSSGSSSVPAPDWMLRREMRETWYLKSLLRRCEGLEPPQWHALMASVRREMLPTGKKWAEAAGADSEKVQDKE